MANHAGLVATAMGTDHTGFYVLCFYVPINAAEAVKEAVFAAGAGRLGTYDRCSWQTQGTGQFRPLPGSTPAIGDVGHTEWVAELKVEVMCSESCLAEAVSALVAAHPYETPAYHYWAVNSGVGR